MLKDESSGDTGNSCHSTHPRPDQWKQKEPQHAVASRIKCRNGALELKAHLQHWERGERMEISSWECRPNLGGEPAFREWQADLPPHCFFSLLCLSLPFESTA